MVARDMENRFLGSLLGLAIGDALGMPISTTSLEETKRRFGRVQGYLPGEPGTDREIPAGEITDETETTLCIVESMTTNNGQIDPENINARLMRLADGPSQHWMPRDIREGIFAAEEHDGLVPNGFVRPVLLASGVTGVPVGLLHGVGAMDADAVQRDVRTVAHLVNGDPAQVDLVGAVARSILAIVREQQVQAAPEPGATATREDMVAAVAAIARDVLAASGFEEVVLDTVNRRRPADSAGALAGALAGARFGASGIPQWMIDGLESRVYLTLAAPWFYRTATRRAGLVIDLRQA